MRVKRIACMHGGERKEGTGTDGGISMLGTMTEKRNNGEERTKRKVMMTAMRSR